MLAQLVGGVGGVIAANTMFGLPAVFVFASSPDRDAQVFSEFIATFGLSVILELKGRGPGFVS